MTRLLVTSAAHDCCNGCLLHVNRTNDLALCYLIMKHMLAKQLYEHLWVSMCFLRRQPRAETVCFAYTKGLPLILPACYNGIEPCCWAALQACGTRLHHQQP